MTTTNYTSAADDAKTIRKALKAKGWSSRDISVRTSTYSMSSSINVTIRRPGIPLAVVEEVASGVEVISRCPVSGEILGGGNRFVNVGFDSTVLRKVRQGVRAAVDAGKTEIADGVRVYARSGEWALFCGDAAGRTAYGIDSLVHQAAHYILANCLVVNLPAVGLVEAA